MREVRSGVRLAVWTVAGFLVLVLLILGLEAIAHVTHEGPLAGTLTKSGDFRALIFGALAITLSVVILWVTVDRWAEWFFAACCLVTLRAIIMAALGRTVSVPSIVAPRIYFAEFAGASALMAYFSYKFVSTKPDWLDSICLVGALTAIANLLVNTSRPSTLASGLVAVSLLALSWLRGHLGTHKVRVQGKTL